MRTLLALAPAVVLSLFSAQARAQGLEPPPPFTPGTPGTPGAPVPGQPQPGPPGMPPSGPQEQQQSDDSQDSGLGLEWVYLNADVGASYVNMTSFSQSQLGLTSTSGGGPAFGIGGGVRLIFFTLGARVRNELVSSLGSLWKLNLEAAFHTRIWRIDPYFGVRGGYDFVGSLSSDAASQAISQGNQSGDVSVHGWNVGPMMGIDFYFSSLVSVGVDLQADFLFLQRPKVNPPSAFNMLSPTQQMAIEQMNPTLTQLYNNSGSSVGFGGTATAHLGIHF
jgi:hypothetical protein